MSPVAALRGLPFFWRLALARLNNHTVRRVRAISTSALSQQLSNEFIVIQLVQLNAHSNCSRRRSCLSSGRMSAALHIASDICFEGVVRGGRFLVVDEAQKLRGFLLFIH